MNNISKLTRTMAGAAILALAATGCADMTETQRGTATGAGVGAGLGALIGSGTGAGAGKGALVGAAVGAVAGNVWSKHMQKQKQDMEQATRGTGVQVSQTADNRLKLEIPSDVSFDTGRSDIKPNFRPILERFAGTLNENPATTVTIIGHTDSTGSPALNQPLSIDRAAHTRDYLTTRGVSPNRIVVDGRADREPIASNDDPAGRARNRRVEIYVAEQQPRG
jgi:outer membrane protein OmpA-like peptidoglycan-associated protein